MGEAMIQTQIASTPKLRSRWLGRFSCLALVGALVGSFAPSAQAGGFFDSLFGGFIGQQRSAPAYSYADPRGDVAQRGESNPNIRVETPAPSSSGGGKAFCVRLCDGRYYPITSASANSTPVQMCSAMCPAAKTKVFHGGEINSAADSSGTRYSKLDQAFAYRKSVVPGCSCNGKDAFGLVQVDAKSDPTLRAGDIVATEDGLKPFQGSKGETRKTADNR
jgi:hypothetical protein